MAWHGSPRLDAGPRLGPYSRDTRSPCARVVPLSRSVFMRSRSSSSREIPRGPVRSRGLGGLPGAGIRPRSTDKFPTFPSPPAGAGPSARSPGGLAASPFTDEVPYLPSLSPGAGCLPARGPRGLRHVPAHGQVSKVRPRRRPVGSCRELGACLPGGLATSLQVRPRDSAVSSPFRDKFPKFLSSSPVTVQAPANLDHLGHL
jgi:hypothetical protein